MRHIRHAVGKAWLPWCAVLAAVLVTTASPVLRQDRTSTPSPSKNRTPARPSREGMSQSAHDPDRRALQQGRPVQWASRMDLLELPADPRGYQTPTCGRNKRRLLFGSEIPAGTELTVRVGSLTCATSILDLRAREEHVCAETAGSSPASSSSRPGFHQPTVGADPMPSSATSRYASWPRKGRRAEPRKTRCTWQSTKTIFGGFRMYVPTGATTGAAGGRGRASFERARHNVRRHARRRQQARGRRGRQAHWQADGMRGRDRRQRWYKLVNTRTTTPVMRPSRRPPARIRSSSCSRNEGRGVWRLHAARERDEMEIGRKQMEGAGPDDCVHRQHISRKYGPLYVFRAKLADLPTRGRTPRSCRRGGAILVGRTWRRYLGSCVFVRRVRPSRRQR